MKFDNATMNFLLQMEADAKICSNALNAFYVEVSSYMVGKTKVRELSENRRMLQARRRLKEASAAMDSVYKQMQWAKEEGMKNDEEE